MNRVGLLAMIRWIWKVSNCYGNCSIMFQMLFTLCTQHKCINCLFKVQKGSHLCMGEAGLLIPLLNYLFDFWFFSYLFYLSIFITYLIFYSLYIFWLFYLFKELSFFLLFINIKLFIILSNIFILFFIIF